MDLSDYPTWIAPTATMIAAVMTAANLGARVTGLGFVVFSLGSVCWAWIGLSSGQTNLLASNSFLTLINLVGIWRWLGRQRAYEEGGQSAAEASRRSAHPTLFAGSQVNGIDVLDLNGGRVGVTVEALMSCENGTLSYVVVRSGGIAGVGEVLRAVPRSALVLSSEYFSLRHSSAWFAKLPALRDGQWPVIPDKPDISETSC